MKGQWGLITGLIIALFIAIFSVINKELVTVNYLFGTAEFPLVIVILSSVLMGGLLIGGVGAYRFYKLKLMIKQLQASNVALEKELSEQQLNEAETDN